MAGSQRRSAYSARTDQGVIVIEDQWSAAVPTLTVTNDVEQVVEDLARAGFDLALPVIYRDSDGQWDGIAVRGARFLDFVPLGCGTYAEARAAMLATREG